MGSGEFGPACLSIERLELSPQHGLRGQPRVRRLALKPSLRSKILLKIRFQKRQTHRFRQAGSIGSATLSPHFAPEGDVRSPFDDKQVLAALRTPLERHNLPPVPNPSPRRFLKLPDRVPARLFASRSPTDARLRASE